MMVAAYLGGGAGETATIVPNTHADSANYPDTARVTVKFGSDGVFTATSLDTAIVTTYNWLLSGSASACTVSASVTSGSFSSGTTSTDLALTSDREWVVSRATVGSKSCTATFTIKSGGTVIATASLTLAAAVS